MSIYLLVFFLQVLFNIFKTMEIKYTYENNVKALLFNSVWINLVSIASVYFSIDSMFKGHWDVMIGYIIGSVTGKWIAMRHFENYRDKVYKLLNKKSNARKRVSK